MRICGHSTSIRLENKFWTILEQLCQAQGAPWGCFSELYQEALGNGMEMSNFASLLRCSCLVHLEARQGRTLPPEGRRFLPHEKGAWHQAAALPIPRFKLRRNGRPAR